MLGISLSSLEDVSGPWQPVHRALSVQTARKTAVSAATHLDCEVANTLHHPAEKTVGGLRGDGVDPLRLEAGDAGQHQENDLTSLTRHDEDKKETLESLTLR